MVDRFHPAPFCFRPVFEIQEGADGLEEPNQVVYTEKDFASTISYYSEKNNDFKESGIAGYRTTTLERNGWYI